VTQALLKMRKLKSGSYDDCRRAGEADEWPQGSKKTYILRDVDDPGEIIAFGFFDTDLETLRNDSDLREQRARFERMVLGDATLLRVRPAPLPSARWRSGRGSPV